MSLFIAGPRPPDHLGRHGGGFFGSLDDMGHDLCLFLRRQRNRILEYREGKHVKSGGDHAVLLPDSHPKFAESLTHVEVEANLGAAPVASLSESKLRPPSAGHPAPEIRFSDV